MNGNSPEAQDYGQACDDAANRALTRMEKMALVYQLMMAIDLAEAGGAKRADILESLIQDVTALDEFGEGALKGGW